MTQSDAYISAEQLARTESLSNDTISPILIWH